MDHHPDKNFELFNNIYLTSFETKISYIYMKVKF